MDFAHRHSRHVPHLWMASPARVLAASDLPHLMSAGVARMLNPRREFLSPIS
jgi:hypothetical protein